VTWRYEAGTLHFVANFGEAAVVLDVGGNERMLWASPSVRRDGSTALLPSWEGIMLKGDRS
jgi:hypothetical protein